MSHLDEKKNAITASSAEKRTSTDTEAPPAYSTHASSQRGYHEESSEYSKTQPVVPAQHAMQPPQYEQAGRSDSQADLQPPQYAQAGRSNSQADLQPPTDTKSRGPISVGQRWGKTPEAPYQRRTVDEVPLDHPVHKIPLEKQEKMRKKGINPVLKAEMDEGGVNKGVWAKVASYGGGGQGGA